MKPERLGYGVDYVARQELRLESEDRRRREMGSRQPTCCEMLVSTVKGGREKVPKCLPMGFGGNELGNGVSEGGVRADVEDRDGVLSVVHTTSR